MRTVFPLGCKAAGHFLFPAASSLLSSFLKRLEITAMPSKSSLSAIRAARYRGHNKKKPHWLNTFSTSLDAIQLPNLT